MKVRFVPLYAGLAAAAFALPALADEMPSDSAAPWAAPTAMPATSTAPTAMPATSTPPPMTDGMFSAVTGDEQFGPAIGNIIITSEYVYRGLPQSRGAAVQGNLDWNLPWGFVIGGWASNNESVGGSEVRGYANWGIEILEGLRADVGGIYYFFSEDNEGESGADLDYVEGYAGVSFASPFGAVAVKGYYSPEYRGDVQETGSGDGDAIYVNVDYTYSFTDDLRASAQVGWSDGDGVETLLGGIEDSYIDYVVSGSKDFGQNYTASLSAVMTDIDGDDPKIIVAVSTAFKF